MFNRYKIQGVSSNTIRFIWSSLILCRTRSHRYGNNGIAPSSSSWVISPSNSPRSGKTRVSVSKFGNIRGSNIHILGSSTHWHNSVDSQLRSHSRPFGPWHIRSQSSLWWRIPGITSPTVLFIGVPSTRPFTKSTTSTRPLLAWLLNMPHRLKWWSWASGLSGARLFGVRWQVNSTFLPCTSGSSCACSRPSMLTVVMNSRGAFTISFPSGLVPITTIYTMRSSSATIPAASGGGTMSLTPSTPRMRWSAEGKTRPRFRRPSKQFACLPFFLHVMPASFNPYWGISLQCSVLDIVQWACVVSHDTYYLRDSNVIMYLIFQHALW